jgi:large subunit ribosomal protein L25
MKSVSLSGSPRENVGKKDAATLRSEGRIPCVLYGGSEQFHFHLKDIDLSKTIFSPDIFIYDLDLGDKGKKKAVVQDAQFHPVTDKVLHVDFLEAMDGKELTVSLPIRTTGAAIGVRNGGRMAFPNRSIKVKGEPKDLPDAITIEVGNVKIGQKIRVGDLKLPGLKILASDDMVLFAVRMARGAIEDEATEEEGAEGAEGEAKPEGEATAES